MAIAVFLAPQLTLNSVDLSDHVRSLTLDYNAKMVEATAGGASTIANLAGLLDWKMDIEFNQDYATGKVDATLFPLVGAAAFAVLFRPTTAVRGTANPEFTGTGVASSYPPISGKIGDMNTTKATIVCATSLARLATP